MYEGPIVLVCVDLHLNFAIRKEAEKLLYSGSCGWTER